MNDASAIDSDAERHPHRNVHAADARRGTGPTCPICVSP